MHFSFRGPAAKLYRFARGKIAGTGPAEPSAPTQPGAPTNETDSHHFNDAPIASAAADRFGMAPFAVALAKGLEGLAAPEGVVFALNGPWGSGKSSVVNLMIEALQPAVDADRLQVVRFEPWSAPGVEALTLAFMQELRAVLGKSASKEVVDALAKVAKRALPHLTKAAPLVGLTTAGAVGAAAAVGAGNFLTGLLDEGSAEKTFRRLRDALTAQQRRFVVIIDDIDRLPPDEAIMIFRLVKSIGRLPNIVYLLVFDRAIAERHLAQAFPSEGPGYLEKIVQGTFDIPEAEADDLRDGLLEQINTLCGVPEQPDEQVRFMNVFLDAVGPWLRTPRDTVRIFNGLSVIWPAVQGEVDRADLVGLEALKLFAPATYRAVRRNPSLLCKSDPQRHLETKENRAARIDRALDIDPQSRDADQIRLVLMRLFPAMEAVWKNTHYGDGFADQWHAARRVCSTAHFGTYFRLALSDETLPAAEFSGFMARSGDRPYVRDYLLAALARPRRGGRTMASLILEELTVFAARVPAEHIGALVNELFAIADRLDVEQDELRGFSMGNNFLRLHWLMNRLVRDRLDQSSRGEIICAALEHASPRWALEAARRYYVEHHPEGRESTPEGERYVDADTLPRVVDIGLGRVRAAAADGSLTENARGLATTLFVWGDLSPSGDAEVRAWTDIRIRADDFIVTIAAAMVRVSWSQGIGDMGDRVARSGLRATPDSWVDILDVPKFRERVAELAARPDLPAPQRRILDALAEGERNAKAS